MARKRTFAREMLQALLVVALVFLNFAHQAPAVAYAADLTPYLLADGAAAAPCEQHPGDDHSAHDNTCHLCRLGGSADLPEPPCAFVAAAQVAMAVDYASLAPALPPFPAASSAEARAPPVA